jgi:hypothetical protein
MRDRHPDEVQCLRLLVVWVRRFTIMYAVLWTTLTLAFFALLLWLGRTS